MTLLERDHYKRTLRLTLECLETLRPAVNGCPELISPEEFEVIRLRISDWLISISTNKNITKTEKETTNE